jgi:hypothetical protein
MAEYGALPFKIAGEQYYLQFTPTDAIALEKIVGLGLPAIFRHEAKGVRIGSAILWAGLKRKDSGGKLRSVFQATDFLGNIQTGGILAGEGIENTPGIKEASEMFMRYTQDPGNNGIYGLFEEFAKGFIATGWFPPKTSPPPDSQEQTGEAS